MTLEETALQKQREKNNEMVSNLMVTLLSIRIQCEANCKTFFPSYSSMNACAECDFFKGPQGCLFNLGHPWEWDDIALASFRDGLDRALEQTLTKGEAANENRTYPNGNMPVSE